MEAIQESFAVPESFTDITEGELLEELRQQEEYYSKRPNGFVSLSNFVRVHLALAGKSYSVPSTYRLSFNGLIKIWQTSEAEDWVNRIAYLPL